MRKLVPRSLFLVALPQRRMVLGCLICDSGTYSIYRILARQTPLAIDVHQIQANRPVTESEQ